MPWHLHVTVDRGAPQSLNEQLRCGIKEAIRDGRLRPGTRLPSSRQLAVDLQVSRSVVVEAYEQLVAEGYLDASERSGTRVGALSGLVPAAAEAEADRPRLAPVRPRHDLRPG